MSSPHQSDVHMHDPEVQLGAPQPGTAGNLVGEPLPDSENLPQRPVSGSAGSSDSEARSDACYCTDCQETDSEDECASDDDLMAVDGDLGLEPVHTPAINAAAFPHIMDAIRDYAVAACPLTARSVSRLWHQCVDKSLGVHVRLDLRAPGLTGNSGREPYCWVFSGAALPVPFLRRSLGPVAGQSLRRSRNDVRSVARTLDVHACEEFVRHPVGTADWDRLSTVRFVQGRGSVAFHTAHTLPHMARIVFSDGPYTRERAAVCPSAEQMFGACSAPACRTPHTRRVVCNLRTPATSDGRDIVPLTRLPELVLVLHGWGVIPGFDPEKQRRRNHPLNEARTLAFFAALEGTQVTIVNPGLRDLRTGRKGCNMGCNMGGVAETLSALWGSDLRHVQLVDGTLINQQQILDRIKFMSLHEYKDMVGEEEFRIETMTDDAAQVPTYW